MNPGKSAAYAAKLRALLPIIEAHALGQQIEYKSRTSDTGWKDCPYPVWCVSATAGEYRIKQQPRTFYTLRYNDSSCMCFASEQERTNYIKKYPYLNGAEALTVVEKLKN
jgi:hypothetical protein